MTLIHLPQLTCGVPGFQIDANLYAQNAYEISIFLNYKISRKIMSKTGEHSKPDFIVPIFCESITGSENEREILGTGFLVDENTLLTANHQPVIRR